MIRPFFLIVALLVSLLPGRVWAETPTPVPGTLRPIAGEVVKVYCNSAFGYTTAQQARTDLLVQAKREAINEIFGEFIDSFVQVENFVITSDRLRALSSGFVRTRDTDYTNSEIWGEVCVTLTAYLTPEDLAQFEPVVSKSEECVTDNNLTVRQLTAEAEELALLNALFVNDRRLQQVDPDLLRQTFTRVRFLNGALRGTSTYCVTAEVEIRPIEVQALLDQSTVTPTPTATSTPRSTLTPVPTVPAMPISTPISAPPVDHVPDASPTWINPGDGAVYVYVPAGEFTMGSDYGYSDQRPAHIVYLDSFWIMRTEVTNRQYGRCVRAGICTAPDNSIWQDMNFAEYPVTDIDWHQSSVYAQWVGGRLPTEAEWEKACRGNGQDVYPWSDQEMEAELEMEADLWDSESGGIGGVTSVGSYPASATPYGVLDMRGNVWEWIADWYKDDYYWQSPYRNPPGPPNGNGLNGDGRVLRGGFYVSEEMVDLCSVRNSDLEFFRVYDIGFRVVVPAPDM